MGFQVRYTPNWICQRVQFISNNYPTELNQVLPAPASQDHSIRAYRKLEADFLDFLTAIINKWHEFRGHSTRHPKIVRLHLGDGNEVRVNKNELDLWLDEKEFSEPIESNESKNERSYFEKIQIKLNATARKTRDVWEQKTPKNPPEATEPKVIDVITEKPNQTTVPPKVTIQDTAQNVHQLAVQTIPPNLLLAHIDQPIDQPNAEEKNLFYHDDLPSIDGIFTPDSEDEDAEASDLKDPPSLSVLSHESPKELERPASSVTFESPPIERENSQDEEDFEPNNLEINNLEEPLFEEDCIKPIPLRKRKVKQQKGPSFLGILRFGLFGAALIGHAPGLYAGMYGAPKSISLVNFSAAATNFTEFSQKYQVNGFENTHSLIAKAQKDLSILRDLDIAIDVPGTYEHARTSVTRLLNQALALQLKNKQSDSEGMKDLLAFLPVAGREYFVDFVRHTPILIDHLLAYGPKDPYLFGMGCLYLARMTRPSNKRIVFFEESQELQETSDFNPSATKAKETQEFLQKIETLLPTIATVLSETVNSDLFDDLLGKIKLLFGHVKNGKLISMTKSGEIHPSHLLSMDRTTSFAMIHHDNNKIVYYEFEMAKKLTNEYLKGVPLIDSQTDPNDKIRFTLAKYLGEAEQQLESRRQTYLNFANSLQKNSHKILNEFGNELFVHFNSIPAFARIWDNSTNLPDLPFVQFCNEKRAP